MADRSTLILPLFRPQYLAVTEGFLNSIAWSAFHSLKTSEGKALGLKYFNLDSQERKLQVQATAPAGEAMVAFEDALKRLGVLPANDQSQLGQATVNSLLGVRTSKGKTFPASPLSPTLALLQNPEGATASENPPPFAGIFEQIFALGSISPSTDTVLTLWTSAGQRRLEIDPLLRAIDGAFLETIFDSKLVARTTAKPLDNMDSYKMLVTRSPMTWFNKAWRKITSDGWVDALPARVWTDWATTILRTGYGLTYLWEASWYESVARTVLDNKTTDVADVRHRMDPVLPWVRKSASADMRDLASLLKTRSQRSVRIREALEDWMNDSPEPFESPSLELNALKKSATHLNRLRDALRPDNNENDGVGVREAVRYALVTRDTEGAAGVDFYGLLKRSGTRYLFADPGVEWVAVMASLACDGPGGSTYLGVLAADLQEAGLGPDIADLTDLLEKAGLARGAADADQGIKVEAAY